MPLETREEFIQRQGGRYIIAADDRLLFPTGASLRPYPGGFTPVEPSPDQRTRLGVQRDYWTAILKMLSAQFTAVQNVARGGLHFLNWDAERLGPRPSGLDAVGLLGWLQEKAVEPQAKLQEVEAQIAALPANKLQTERERRLKVAMAKRRSEALQRLREVESMTLISNRED